MELQSTFKVRCIPYIVARHFIKRGNQKNSSNSFVVVPRKTNTHWRKNYKAQEASEQPYSRTSLQRKPIKEKYIDGEAKDLTGAIPAKATQSHGRGIADPAQWT